MSCRGPFVSEFIISRAKDSYVAEAIEKKKEKNRFEELVFRYRNYVSRVQLTITTDLARAQPARHG